MGCRLCLPSRLVPVRKDRSSREIIQLFSAYQRVAFSQWAQAPPARNSSYLDCLLRPKQSGRPPHQHRHRRRYPPLITAVCQIPTKKNPFLGAFATWWLVPSASPSVKSVPSVARHLHIKKGRHPISETPPVFPFQRFTF